MMRIVVADGLAHRLADLDVGLPDGRRVDFVGAPAARLERLAPPRHRPRSRPAPPTRHRPAHWCGSCPSACERHAGQPCRRGPRARRRRRRARAAGCACAQRPHMRWKCRSRSSGSSPTSIGFRILMIRLASWLAGRLAEPRKACPSTPWSVLMVTRPRSLLPAKRPVWRPYCVAGMSSQAKRVTVTSVIFMGGLLQWRCVGPRLQEPRAGSPHELKSRS